MAQHLLSVHNSGESPYATKEDMERAFRDVARGERIETLSYFSETLGRPPLRSVSLKIVPSSIADGGPSTG